VNFADVLTPDDIEPVARASSVPLGHVRQIRANAADLIALGAQFLSSSRNFLRASIVYSARRTRALRSERAARVINECGSIEQSLK